MIPEELVVPVAELNRSFGLDTWVYRGVDWYVPDPAGAHVARESATVRFHPKVMISLDGLTSDVAKPVGVSDDLDAIATIGDMPNDVLMFAHSGLGIVMGNASPEVQRAARRITTSKAEEGFATAVDRFIRPPN